jgi:hypothetical protein
MGEALCSGSSWVGGYSFDEAVEVDSGLHFRFSISGCT